MELPGIEPAVPAAYMQVDGHFWPADTSASNSRDQRIPGQVWTASTHHVLRSTKLCGMSQVWLQWGFAGAGVLLECVIVWAYVTSPPMGKKRDNLG